MFPVDFQTLADLNANQESLFQQGGLNEIYKSEYIENLNENLLVNQDRSNDEKLNKNVLTGNEEINSFGAESEIKPEPIDPELYKATPDALMKHAEEQLL